MSQKQCLACVTPTTCSRFGCKETKANRPLTAVPTPARKASHDTCFKEGCAETNAGREGCVGMCMKQYQEEQGHGTTAAQGLAGQSREPAKAEGPVQEAAVEDTASEQAAKLKALKDLVEGRLCCECKHYKKPMGLPVTFGLCGHPYLPINLITGHRIFPAITARQHAELCGYAGAHWKAKKL